MHLLQQIIPTFGSLNCVLRAQVSISHYLRVFLKQY